MISFTRFPCVFSSRKLERATYDSVALRFIAANQHPGAMPEFG